MYIWAFLSRARLTSSQTSQLAGGHSTSPSLATEFNVASHLSLLSSLATLSDAPALAPLPSTSDASAPTSSPLTAHPTAWSLALGREQDRLAALPHPSPPPTSRHQPQSTRNLSLLFPSTSSTSSHLSSTLLRSTSPTESIESRLASLLDSLEPNPTTKAEPVRAPLAPLRRSKLPARTTAPPLRGDVKGEGGRGAGEGVVQGLRVEKLGLQRDLGERGARASKEGQSLMLELLGEFGSCLTFAEDKAWRYGMAMSNQLLTLLALLFLSMSAEQATNWNRRSSRRPTALVTSSRGSARCSQHHPYIIASPVVTWDC